MLDQVLDRWVGMSIRYPDNMIAALHFTCGVDFNGYIQQQEFSSALSAPLR